MGKIIGYARVANSESDIEVQKTALRAAGCTPIFEDIGSGKLPSLTAALAALSSGDTLVVNDLSRLSRSSTHRLEIIDKLHLQGIFLRSLREEVNTAQDSNPMIFRLERFVDGVYAESLR